MIERGFYDELKKILIPELSGIFKRIDDCDKQVKIEDEKIEKIFNDISQMRQEFTMMRIERAKDSTKLSVLIGILCTIAVPLVALCVKMLFG